MNNLDLIFRADMGRAPRKRERKAERTGHSDDWAGPPGPQLLAWPQHIHHNPIPAAWNNPWLNMVQFTPPPTTQDFQNALALIGQTHVLN